MTVEMRLNFKNVWGTQKWQSNPQRSLYKLKALLTVDIIKSRHMLSNSVCQKQRMIPNPNSMIFQNISKTFYDFPKTKWTEPSKGLWYKGLKVLIVEDVYVN